MKLGQRIFFRRELTPNNIPLNMDELDRRQSREFEYQGYVTYHKYKIRKHKVPVEGVLVGIRSIGIKNLISRDPFEEEEFVKDFVYKTEREKIALVATNLQKFHKVKIRDIIYELNMSTEYPFIKNY